jgi:hypothetical protein
MLWKEPGAPPTLVTVPPGPELIVVVLPGLLTTPELPAVNIHFKVGDASCTVPIVTFKCAVLVSGTPFPRQSANYIQGCDSR